jgi:hypothetical protein
MSGEVIEEDEVLRGAEAGVWGKAAEGGREGGTAPEERESVEDEEVSDVVEDAVDWEMGGDWSVPGIAEEPRDEGGGSVADERNEAEGEEEGAGVAGVAVGGGTLKRSLCLLSLRIMSGMRSGLTSSTTQ